MNPGPDPDFAHLLRDGAWLRSFVRTLVPARDVDDLVQSTWLAALQQRVVMQRPSLWLRGAARNLARMLHRQQLRTRRRESISRATEPVPSAADLVAGLEVQRFVSDALLALPEPTRSIFVLRYHEDLEPAAIAARLGLQAAAVRQRLHRGRQLVRARFEQRFGRDWRGGAVVLAFVGPDSGSGSGVAAGAAFAAVTAIAVCACVAWLPNWSSIARSEPKVEPLTAASAPVAAHSADRSPRARTDAPVERSLVASPEQDPAPAAPASGIELRGRIVAAEDGQPLAGARLTTDLGWRSTTPKQERIAPAPFTTRADGQFAIVVPLAAVSISVWIHVEGRCTRWHEASPPKATELGDVPMARGYAVRCQLVDEAGLPMQAVRIETLLDGAFPDGGGLLGWPCTADARGAFVCPLVPAGKLRFLSGQPGVELLEPAVDIVASAEPMLVQLRGRRLPSIRGVVFGPDGMPCKGVSLQAQVPPYRGFDVHGEGTSAGDGSFEVFRMSGEAEQVAILPSPTGAHELAAAPTLHAWGTAGLRLEVRPLVPVRLRVLEDDTAKPVERFGVRVTRWIGDTEFSTGGTNLEFHDAGTLTFAGLAEGTRILLWSDDADLAPAALFVDESMATTPCVDVVLARLHPFPLTLVDANGQPVAIEVHVLDRARAEQPGPWTDLRAGRSQTGHSPLHLSVATTDATGAATLLAPTDRRDLVVAVRRGERDVWLPLALPAPGQPVRLMLPQ